MSIQERHLAIESMRGNKEFNFPQEGAYFWGPETKEQQERLLMLVKYALNGVFRMYNNEVALRREDFIVPLSKEGEIIRQILTEEQEKGRRFTPNFMGQIHPQGNIVAQVGMMIGEVLNTNAIVAEVSPVEMKLEKEALGWLMGIFGYDRSHASGIFTSGGTMANMTALTVAREKFVRQNGPLMHGQKAVIIAPHTVHYSVKKAASLLGGLNRDIVVHQVGLNDQFTTDVNEVNQAIREIENRGDKVMAILGIAGSTELGTVDDLVSLGELAKKHNVFFIVDAAYGGPFVLSKRSALFAGIEKADAITVDPHKMLYVPYPAGVVLFKDARDHSLLSEIAGNARYLESSMRVGSEEERLKEFLQNPNDLKKRLEGSLGTGGIIATWASIQLFGKTGFANIFNHLIDLTDYFYQRVQNSELLEPLAPPQTNALCVRVKNYGRTEVIDGVRGKLESNRLYVGKTEFPIAGSEVAMFKIIIMHPRTTREHVDLLLSTLESSVKEVLIGE